MAVGTGGAQVTSCWGIPKLRFFTIVIKTLKNGNFSNTNHASDFIKLYSNLLLTSGSDRTRKLYRLKKCFNDFKYLKIEMQLPKNPYAPSDKYTLHSY